MTHLKKARDSPFFAASQSLLFDGTSKFSHGSLLSWYVTRKVTCSLIVNFHILGKKYLHSGLYMFLSSGNNIKRSIYFVKRVSGMKLFRLQFFYQQSQNSVIIDNIRSRTNLLQMIVGSLNCFEAFNLCQLTIPIILQSLCWNKH